MRNTHLWLTCVFMVQTAACAIGRTQDPADDQTKSGASTAGALSADGQTGASTASQLPDGSAGTPTPGGAQSANDTIVAVPNVVANYTTTGRFSATNGNSLTFALPSSRIGGRFTGTTLALSLSDTGYDHFDVTLDGNTFVAPTYVAQTGCLALAEAQAQSSNANATSGCIATTPSTIAQTYVVATNLPPGQHTVWLTKRTEMYQGSGTGAVGQTSFYGFVLDANATLLTPPSPRPRLIDFVGDSGFTGYGAAQLMHNSNDYCDFTPGNQDAAASVPYLTGALLNADVVNVSSSGQGVVNGVYDTNKAHLLPVLYEETLPPATSPAFDFSVRQADVVVLAGGGDDLIGASGSGHFADPNAFVAGYVAWLQKIRSHYPKARIVCALTSGAQTGDIATLGGALQQAVQTAADPNIVYYSFFMNETTLTTYSDIAAKCGFDYGCKYHPSPAGAQWLAGRLAAFIRAQMQWTN